MTISQSARSASVRRLLSCSCGRPASVPSAMFPQESLLPQNSNDGLLPQTQRRRLHHGPPLQLHSLQYVHGISTLFIITLPHSEIKRVMKDPKTPNHACRAFPVR
ncbi:hypothetical protein BDW66DRAFT_47751 [Aspergillus desertorum]